MKTRLQNLEQHYKNSVTEAITQLMMIMEPGSELERGAMDYSQLLEFAEKKLNAERLALQFAEDEPNHVLGTGACSTCGKPGSIGDAVTPLLGLYESGERVGLICGDCADKQQPVKVEPKVELYADPAPALARAATAIGLSLEDVNQ